MSDSALANPQSIQSKMIIPALFLFALVILGLLLLGSVWHDEQKSTRWISLLFFIPCVLQFIGLCVLRNRTTRAFWWFNFGATLCCQVSYFGLWIMYTSDAWKPSQWLSIIALGLTFLMLLFVAVMTYAIMGKRDGDSLEKEVPAAKRADQAQPDGLKPEEKDQSARRWIRFCGWWERFSRNLSAGVGDHPFWAMMFFMALFLGVSYLFGFALAFHDQYARKENKEKPALHMTKLESIDDGNTTTTTGGRTDGGESAVDNSQTAQNTTSASDASPTSSSGEQEEYCFYFDELKANVKQGDETCTKGNPKRTDSYFPRPLFNRCSLDAIASRIQKETDNAKRVKVTLLGHADNEPIKIPTSTSTSTTSTSISYLSNYELSEARAQNVQHEILQKLRHYKDHKLENIEWVIFPAAGEVLSQINRGAIRKEMFSAEELNRAEVRADSNREEFLSRIETSFAPEVIDRKLPSQEKRVVIATIETLSQSPVVLKNDQYSHLMDGEKRALDKLDILNTAMMKNADQSQSKQMRLMDYMYFSIYTITTTGYGDIIPTTAYAKFVTSVANIFEVIFLVVFFNALLSLKKSPDDDSTARLKALRDSLKGKEDLDTDVQGKSNVATLRSPAAKGRGRR